MKRGFGFHFGLCYGSETAGVVVDDGVGGESGRRVRIQQATSSVFPPPIALKRRASLGRAVLGLKWLILWGGFM